MSDPYIKEIVKQKSNWIEDITNKNIPSEESLKDFSKGMLAHNIACLKDDLSVITSERDEMEKECKELSDEIQSLKLDNMSLDKDVQLYKIENDQLKIVIKDQRKRIEDLKKKIIKK